MQRIPDGGRKQWQCHERLGNIFFYLIPHMLWEMVGVTVALDKTYNTEVEYYQQRTSFLFVIVDLPFGCSWALTNLDQSYFTICGSIEDFLSCANIIDIILELIPLKKSYVSGHGGRWLASIFVVQFQDRWRAGDFYLIGQLRSLQNEKQHVSCDCLRSSNSKQKTEAWFTCKTLRTRSWHARMGTRQVMFSEDKHVISLILSPER